MTSLFCERCCKTFTGCHCRFGMVSQCVLHLSLVFVSKVKSLTGNTKHLHKLDKIDKCQNVFQCCKTQQLNTGPYSQHFIHNLRMKLISWSVTLSQTGRLARDKHSSFWGKYVSYEKDEVLKIWLHKCFKTLGPTKINLTNLT